MDTKTSYYIGSFKDFSRRKSDYRFHFNGQETDDEIAGKGNINTAEYWEYDIRLGRRWNLDPVPIDGISEYSCFRNIPILYSDPNGDKIKFDKDASKEFKKDFKKAALHLVTHGQFSLLARLVMSKQVYTLKEFDGTNSAFMGNYLYDKQGHVNGGNGGTIFWNPRNAKKTETGAIISPVTILNHEFDHAADFDKDPVKHYAMTQHKNSQYGNAEEARVITGSEQETARALGEIKGNQITRINHSSAAQILVNDPTATKGTEIQPYVNLGSFGEIVIKSKLNNNGKRKKK